MHDECAKDKEKRNRDKRESDKTMTEGHDMSSRKET